VILAEAYQGNWNPNTEPRNTYLKDEQLQTNAVIVRKNRYDQNRAHIAIYNFKKQDSVIVDISSLNWKNGDRYEVRNAQDYFGDILQGIYDGNQNITIPMTGHSVAVPYDWRVPKSTFPTFGAFVLVRRN
jgi:hypothetical protein